MWDDGSQLFEGEFNRAVVSGIVQDLTLVAILYVVITPEMRDITLRTRVQRANQWDSPGCFFLSVHANAGGGHGFEVYTHPGETRSDKLATIFGEEFKKQFPSRRLRTDYSDGDLDKEARFYVLAKTYMPAVLTENFFMDNEDECRSILLTKEGRASIVEFHVRAIRRAQEVF